MREFKFRAWHHGGGDPRIEPYMTCVSFSKECFWRNVEQESLSVEVMQFTGLTDKNGAEIYEGDIVSDHVGIGRVVYAGDCAAFKVSYHGENRGLAKWFMDYLAREFKTIEVIGNIYQNPESIENNN